MYDLSLTDSADNAEIYFDHCTDLPSGDSLSGWISTDEKRQKVETGWRKLLGVFHLELPIGIGGFGSG